MALESGDEKKLDVDGAMDGVGGVSCEEYEAKIDELNQIIEGLFTKEVRRITYEQELEKIRRENNVELEKLRLEKEKAESEKADACCKHAAELAAIKSDHLSFVAALEARHTDRLASLTNKIERLQNEVAATEESKIKEINLSLEQHQADILELSDSKQNSINELNEEISTLKAQVDTCEKMRMAQQEELENSYENELLNQSFEYEKRLEGNQVQLDDLCINNQKLVAKRCWLEKQASELKSQVIDVQHERLEISEKSKKHQSEIRSLKSILKEKDEIIAQMKAEKSQMNADKNQLQKELYVAKTKCDDFQLKLTPLDETIEEHQQQNVVLSKQLHDSRYENDALKQTIEIQEQSKNAKDAELKSLRSTVRNRERKLKAIEGEIVQLARITDDKALGNQVKIAYQKLLNIK